MKKTIIAAVMLALACSMAPSYAKGSKGGGSHASRGGHYSGGKGSAHKGGKYKNSRTGDHYQKRSK
jgi:hypothetical protein